MTRVALIVLALYTGDPCVEMCEVLDMEHLATTPQACLCFDPVTKRVELFPRVRP